MKVFGRVRHPANWAFYARSIGCKGGYPYNGEGEVAIKNPVIH